MKFTPTYRIAAVLLSLASFNTFFMSQPSSAFGQDPEFTYQGRLDENGVPASGVYDFRFTIYNGSETNPALAALSVTDLDGVAASNGLFTVRIAAPEWVFNGERRWLAVEVRSNATGGLTMLHPWTEITPTPYAVRALTVTSNALDGGYEGAVAFSNPSNAFVGTFTGDGSGLTDLNASQLGSGTVPDARLSANVALLNATQTFTGANSFSGNISLLDPTRSITFPATGGANSPMMNMFASGTANADRMVIAHSPPFPTWGLQYQDSSDKFNFLAGGSPVMTVDLSGRRVGIGTTVPASALHILSSGTPPGSLASANNGLLLGIQSTSGYKWIQSYGGALALNPIGNSIGIGTSTPQDALLDIEGYTHINDYDLFLRTGTDRNHGLGFRNTINGIFVDGPFLYGFDGGALGASPDIVTLKWDWQGNVWVSNDCSVATLSIRGGADLAEPFNFTSGRDEVKEGAVVIIDDENPGCLKLSDRPYDTRVAGVVSGANGINPGIQMHQQGIVEGGKNVALTGRVYVQADASNGAIKPGDLLTTSATPGAAMKVTDHARAQGAILGKAMTGLSAGRGTVLVLVTLQ